VLTRLEFREGGLLRACDLEAALAGEEERRALHARAMHRARGVALGFEVSLQLGGQAVAVAPGFGYDRRGREVISGRTVLVNAPTQDAVFDLGVGAGPCAEWLWLEPAEVRDELVVARVEVSGGTLGEPDVTERRVVRGAGGRIGTGTQQVAALDANDVDTKAAEFQWPTYYFMSVEGLDGASLPRLPALEVEDSAPDGFRVKVGYAGGPSRLDLHWLGVESPELVTD
jgi:hypothetical protein